MSSDRTASGTPAQLGAVLRCFVCGENRRWPGERACFHCLEHTVDNPECDHPVVKTMVGGADVCQSCGRRW